MPRAKAPFKLSGSLQNLTFFNIGDKQFVKTRPETRRKQWKQEPGRQAWKDSVQAFAGASKCAGNIYTQVTGNDPQIKRLCRPYAHNHIATLIRSEATALREIADGYTFSDLSQVLRRLDLSHKGAPSSKIRFAPKGAIHKPTAFRITGLAEAARSLNLPGSAQLEFRIHLRRAIFPEFILYKEGQRWDAHSKGFRNLQPVRPSSWIPVDLLPAKGLSIDLPTGEVPYPAIFFIVVEWRELNPNGKTKHTMHKQAIVKVAAIHCETGHLPPSSLHLMQPQPTRRYCLPKRYPKRIHLKNRKPQTFLNIALSSLLGPKPT